MTLELFNPGDGWREVKYAPDFGQRHLVERGGGNEVRYWVPVKPVPPLPTEPYTVIRVTWAPNQKFVHPIFMLIADDWCNAHADVLDEQGSITGFEVLAKPC